MGRVKVKKIGVTFIRVLDELTIRKVIFSDCKKVPVLMVRYGHDYSIRVYGREIGEHHDVVDEKISRVIVKARGLIRDQGLEAIYE